jgi:phage-related protein
VEARLITEGHRRSIFALARKEGKCDFLEYIQNLDAKTQAKVVSRVEYLSNVELPIRNTDFSEKLCENLFELKVRYQNLFIRVFYFFFEGDIIFIHGFNKKTNKTPSKEISLAVRTRDRFLQS